MHTDFDWNDAPNMRVPGAPAEARRGRSSAAGMPRIPEVDWSQAPNVRAASFDLEPAPVEPSWFESRLGRPLQTCIKQTRSFSFVNVGTEDRPVFEHDTAETSLTGGLRLAARDRRLSSVPVEEVVAMGISRGDESTLSDERTTHRLPLELGIPAESRRDEAVVGEAAPRLFFSSRRLAVRPWSRSVSELVPELLGEPERPMWWDVWPG